MCVCVMCVMCGCLYYDVFFSHTDRLREALMSERSAGRDMTVKTREILLNDYAGRLAGHRVSASAFTFSDFHESGSCPFIL